MIYKIPLFDLNVGIEEEVAILKTLRSKWISMGENVVSIEKKFAHHLHIKHAVGVSSCTAALHLALMILGIKKGDEVIVPSLTFIATVNAVRYVGAIPVFADIVSPEILNISHLDVTAKITKKTKAIIAMHYGGFACDMDSIIRIARKNNLYLVEDAAHAPDSQYKNQMLGTLGDIGCFSFYSNKIITCAEGGMLVTKNSTYNIRAKRLRSNGMSVLSYDRAKAHATEYDICELGYNYRMDDIRAGILLAQLNKLKSDVRKRQELRNYYIDKLSSVTGITIPYRHFPYRSSNYIFPIILNGMGTSKRNAIRQKLGESGIQTSVHYPCVHRFSIYRGYKAHLKMTEYVSDNLITLPLFYNLSYRQIDYIVKMLKEAI